MRECVTAQLSKSAIEREVREKIARPRISVAFNSGAHGGTAEKTRASNNRGVVNADFAAAHWRQYGLLPSFYAFALAVRRVIANTVSPMKRSSVVAGSGTSVTRARVKLTRSGALV